MGCASPESQPTATSAPYIAFELDLKIEPREAATFLLNPTPIGKAGYPQGMTVTIDILPKQGWQLDKWVGPVINIDGTTAQIEMNSSQSVAVLLKSTTPLTTMPTSNYTPIPPTKTLISKSTKVPKPLVRPTPVPTSVPLLPAPKGSASSYFEKGEGYSLDGKYRLAIVEFSTAIMLNPGYTSAYWARGWAYDYLNQYPQAIQDFDKAIQLDPYDVLPYISRGFSYYRSNSYQQAIRDFDKAIQLDPYDSLLLAMAYDGRSKAHDSIGNHGIAGADNSKACSLDSQYC